MPAKREDTHQLIDRELVVFTRPDTKVYYCRYKIDGKWITATTKETDLKKAKAKAHSILLKAQIMKEQNLPVISKKFRDVIKLTIKSWDDAEKAGNGKISYTQYKRIANDYLTPFFGNKGVDTITHTVLTEYYEWAAKKMGKAPAYSTIRKHNVTLNYVFEQAVTRGFMTSSQKPMLETKGKKSEPFETFQIAEINAIIALFPSWIARGVNEYKRELRQILFDYVRTLIDTGARPGKELLNLRWKNITYRMYVRNAIEEVFDEEKMEMVKRPIPSLIVEDDDVENYQATWDPEVLLYVDGKTDGRIVNGFRGTYEVLQGIAKRNYKTKKLTLKQLTESKNEDYVFATKSGERSNSLNHMFTDFLTEHNLYKDPNTGKNRVFYSLRSAHSTAVMNMDNVSPRSLAIQLGNSPEVIQKHYDRADGAAITENVRAPNARSALFNKIEVPDIYKSKKKPRKAK